MHAVECDFQICQFFSASSFVVFQRLHCSTSLFVTFQLLHSLYSFFIFGSSNSSFETFIGSFFILFIIIILQFSITHLPVFKSFICNFQILHVLIIFFRFFICNVSDFSFAVFFFICGFQLLPLCFFTVFIAFFWAPLSAVFSISSFLGFQLVYLHFFSFFIFGFVG